MSHDRYEKPQKTTKLKPITLRGNHFDLNVK